MSRRKHHKIAPGLVIGQCFPAKITTYHVSSLFPPTQTFLSSQIVRKQISVQFGRNKRKIKIYILVEGEENVFPDLKI